MRRLVVSVLTVAVLVAAVLPLAARAKEKKEIKIVAAASLAGFDAVMTDIELMGELSGQEKASKMAKAVHAFVTKTKGFSGLDHERPWGVLIGTDGEDFGGCAFVPVADLKKLMAMAKMFAKGKIKEHKDGIYEIDGGHKRVYVQETHKGWAFMVDDPDLFQYMPEDPAAALEGLNEQYDAAMRIFPANVPAHHREKLRAKMQQCCEKRMARHKKDDKHCRAIHVGILESLLQRHRQKWVETDCVLKGVSRFCHPENGSKPAHPAFGSRPVRPGWPDSNTGSGWPSRLRTRPRAGIRRPVGRRCAFGSSGPGVHRSRQ